MPSSLSAPGTEGDSSQEEFTETHTHTLITVSCSKTKTTVTQVLTFILRTGRTWTVLRSHLSTTLNVIESYTLTKH